MGRCDFKPGEKLNSRLETEQKKWETFLWNSRAAAARRANNNNPRRQKLSTRTLRIALRYSPEKAAAAARNVLMENHRVQIHGEAAERERKRERRPEWKTLDVVRWKMRADALTGRENFALMCRLMFDTQWENVYVFITCSLFHSLLLGWKVFFFMWSKGIFLLAENFLCVFMSPSFERFYDGRSWAQNWVGAALIIQHNTRNHFCVSNRLSWWARARLTHDTNSIKVTTKKYFYIFSCDRVYMLVCLTSTPKKKTSTTLTLLSRSIGMVCCCWHIAFLPLTVTQNIYLFTLSLKAHEMSIQTLLYFL